MNAVEWIVDKTSDVLDPVAYGDFPTPDGKLGVIDPLCTTETAFFDVPTLGAKLIVLFDEESNRESKLVLVFSDDAVTGGAYHGDCAVDGGAVSPVTPATLTALNAFRATLPAEYPSESPNYRYPPPNLYIEHFEQYDEAGAEPGKAALPDGTPVPFVRSGWGDGHYPVFTLTDKEGSLCAVYCDFMGCEKTENWVMPPGVTMT